MVHGLASRHSLLVIITQQFVKEVERLRTDELFIVAVNKSLPPLPRMSEVQQYTRTLVSVRAVGKDQGVKTVLLYGSTVAYGVMGYRSWSLSAVCRDGF